MAPHKNMRTSLPVVATTVIFLFAIVTILVNCVIFNHYWDNFFCHFIIIFMFVIFTLCAVQ